MQLYLLICLLDYSFIYLFTNMLKNIIVDVCRNYRKYENNYFWRLDFLPPQYRLMQFW